MNVSWQLSNSRLISAEVRLPELDLVEPWNDLAARLETNAFMHPVALRAATDTGFAKIYVLLAWDEKATPRRPVGFWALRERDDVPLLPAFLEALPYNYAFASTAMIDGACADEVVDAFFDAVKRDVRLPKVVSLRSFEVDPIVYPAMLRCLASRGRYRELLRVERPFAEHVRMVKKSGSARKKFRQLSAMGAVKIVNERTPAGAEAAFEVFLNLEAASWKGKEGTALLCDANDAHFSRRFIQSLAACGLASVALLCVDGDAIAAQVLLYSGQRSYTWKTAFKMSFARFSPGLLLADQATRGLLESGQITTVDSCSTPDGFMGQVLTGRRTFVDALIDVRPRNRLAFAIRVAQHRSYDAVCHMKIRMRRAIKRLGTTMKALLAVGRIWRSREQRKSPPGVRA